MHPERRQQVERLVSEALTHSFVQRAKFVADACAGDDDLRQQVEAWLAASDQTRSFVAGDSKPESGAEHAFSPGDRIGRYQILSLLGFGGMGQVWLAKDTMLDRKVALKLLRDKFSGDAVRLQRFFREAKA